MYNEKQYDDESLFELNQDNFKESFCNSNICKVCKGSCCKRGPCIFSPYDFLNITDIDYMKGILDTGLVCISVLPENREILILRPRGIYDKNSIFSVTTKLNPCLLCQISGCMFDEQYRPCQGLLYVPNVDRDIIHHSVIYSPDKIEDDYIKYQIYLKNLICEYKSKDILFSYDRFEENVNNLVKKLIE